MEYVGAGAALAIVFGLIGFWILRWLAKAGSEIQVSRARESFDLQRSRLEEMFLEAASKSGKPRGLRWTRCEFGGDLHLAKDQRSGELLGLIPVTISFEAIPGSDMEGLPAVSNLRDGSAVFTFRRGHWETAGRAVFNLGPAEAISHFGPSYQEVHEPTSTPVRSA